MNLREAFTTTLNMHWAGTRSEEENWRIAQAWLADGNAKFHVTQMTGEAAAAACELWRSVDGLAPATLNRRVAVLSKALHTAHELGHLPEVPKLPRFKEPAPIDRSLTSEQIIKLYNKVGGLGNHQGQFMGALIQFLFNTGARLGEAMGAAWEDMVNGRWTIRRSKNGHSRIVPLNGGAQAALEQLVTLTGDHPMPFGSYATTSQVQHWWAKARVWAKIPHARLHDLRHTCASNLVRKNVSLYTVQHLLGHRNINTTMRYAHQNTEALEEAVKLL